MTQDEYNEMLMREQLMQRNGCGTAAVVIMLLLSVTLLCGCRTQYVPVETIKTEVVHQTDTVEKKVEVNKETNTIIREGRPEDSVLLAKLGIKLAANERLLVIQQEQINNLLNNLKEVHYKDSVRVDSVQVPYPVERKLNRWEKICIDYGKIMIGATVVTFIAFVVILILWLKRRFGHP